MKTKKVALYGLLIALAFVFSYIESLVSIPIPVPGVKLGLANLVVLVALYRIDGRSAVFVSVIRVMLAGILFHNMVMVAYSLSGCSLSLIVMMVLKKTGRFGIPGVSVAGGVAHNVGQILAAMVLLETKAFVYYLPVLLVSGCIAGVLIGIIGAEAVKRVPNLKE